MQSIIDAPRLTIPQVARKFGVHISAVYRWQQRGIDGVKLPFTRIGGASFVLVADMEDFIRRRSDPPSASRAAADRADIIAARADRAGQQLDALGVA